MATRFSMARKTSWVTWMRASVGPSSEGTAMICAPPRATRRAGPVKFRSKQMIAARGPRGVSQVGNLPALTPRGSPKKTTGCALP
jgi:hypothetical protein